MGRAPMYTLAIPQHTFMGVIWSMTAVALLFLGVRLYARWRGPRRLYWDDGIIIFAAVLVLITAILWQVTVHIMYEMMDVSAGRKFPTATLVEDVKRFMTVSYVAQTFFYTSLCAVKISVLLFFRRLGQHLDRLRFVWYPLLALVLITWIVGLSDAQFKCFLGPIEYIMTQCGTKSAVKFTTVTLKVNCALDVISDFFIMSIPVLLVWGVRMRTERKLAFIGLFSLTMITIIIAIVRVVGVTDAKWVNGQDDLSYLWLWTAVEPCIAIVVACLSAFPQLFIPSKKSQAIYKPSASFIQRFRTNKSGSNRRTPHDITLTQDLDTMVTVTGENFNYVPMPDHNKSMGSTSTLHNVREVDMQLDDLESQKHMQQQPPLPSHPQPTAHIWDGRDHSGVAHQSVSLPIQRQ